MSAPKSRKVMRLCATPQLNLKIPLNFTTVSRSKINGAKKQSAKKLGKTKSIKYLLSNIEKVGVLSWSSLLTVDGMRPKEGLGSGGVADMTKWSPSMVATSLIGRLIRAKSVRMGSSAVDCWAWQLSHRSELPWRALNNNLSMLFLRCRRRFFDSEMTGLWTSTGLGVLGWLSRRDLVVAMRHIDKRSTYPQVTEVSNDFLDYLNYN